jgi:hypothetical protein
MFALFLVCIGSEAPTISSVRIDDLPIIASEPPEPAHLEGQSFNLVGRLG